MHRRVGFSWRARGDDDSGGVALLSTLDEPAYSCTLMCLETARGLIANVP